MSLETRIKDLAELIGLEVKSIRTTVDYHNDVEISPSTALDGDQVVIVSNKLVVKPRPIIIESPDGEWLTTTNDFDTPNASNEAVNLNVSFRENGLWKPSISFLYSNDSTGNDFEATCTLDGTTIAKCQPITNQIIKEEGKDAAGTNPDNTSAGTSQVKGYKMDFSAIQISDQNPKELILLFGPETGGTEANIGEITIKFERVYNIIKS